MNIPESSSIIVEWSLTKTSEKIKVKSYDGDKGETQDPRYQGRTELFRTELRKGNMSLHLKNSQLFDQGTYTCMVFIGNWYDDAVIELRLIGELSL